MKAFLIPSALEFHQQLYPFLWLLCQSFIISVCICSCVASKLLECRWYGRETSTAMDHASLSLSFYNSKIVLTWQRVSEGFGTRWNRFSGTQWGLLVLTFLCWGARKKPGVYELRLGYFWPWRYFISIICIICLSPSPRISTAWGKVLCFVHCFITRIYNNA